MLLMPFVLLLIFLACGGICRGSEARVERDGVVFFTYTTKPEDVELYWLNPEGKPFRQFSALQKHLHEKGRRLRFVMNGGLFEADGSPCGLLVIDGRTVRPLNTRDGVGNFYLKPNGVFFIDAKGAHVLSTEEYALKTDVPRLAIQSGPLLLRNGQIHPAFRKTSKNDLHRNGVGVREDGTVLFAITKFDQPRRVTLHGFAEFFRDQGCRDALFLDGDLSQMFVDPEDSLHPGNSFGTIFAVTEGR